MAKSMRATFALLTLLICQTVHLEAHHPRDFHDRLEVIAFGSCNRQNLPQPLWPIIASNQPDLWIWAGDNIYGDSTNPETIAERYALQLANANYQAFREQYPIIGTWDDHDYGMNDADKHYPIKQLTQQMALDFMEVPTDDPRRHREGIYGAYDFGPEGQQVKVVLLDGRYFATGPHAESPELLGEKQKQWLTKELEESTAQIHLLVSGIQILSKDHKWESWARYPCDREWLLDLIAQTQTPGVILISGDRHIHELSILKDSRISYPLVDATSSGMTHYWKSFKDEPNQHRAGEVYKGLGFGLIKLKWSESSCTAEINIRNANNEIENQVTLKLSAQ